MSTNLPMFDLSSESRRIKFAGGVFRGFPIIGGKQTMDGRIYLWNGSSLVRHRPQKPWNSKAERKQVLKQRRKERGWA